MLILVTGSIYFTNKQLMQTILSKYPNAKFRHGGADGADKMVSKLFPSQIEKVFRPKYSGTFSEYDRKAPLKRNIEMLETEPIPDLVIAFYHGTKTGGTLFTVTEAIKRKILVKEYIQKSVNIKQLFKVIKAGLKSPDSCTDEEIILLKRYYPWMFKNKNE